MFRFRDSKVCIGFVNGIRSVVLRDNNGENRSENPYERHALYSYNSVDKYRILLMVDKQKKQLYYRNLFQELPYL
jgi:hypothetical protein